MDEYAPSGRLRYPFYTLEVALFNGVFIKTRIEGGELPKSSSFSPSMGILRWWSSRCTCGCGSGCGCSCGCGG